MQEGAGVRQIVEDALRRQGVGCAISTCGSSSAPGVRAAGSRGRVRRDVHLATAVEADLAAGHARRGSRRGLDATREISLASATGRARTRVAEAFVEFARERLAG